MPSSIPFDPSLVLGNIVPLRKLEILVEIGKLQAPIDAAEEALNGAIELLRGLDLTTREMLNLGIETPELMAAREAAKVAVSVAATALVAERIKGLALITPLKSQLGLVSESIESPVDYNRTNLKTMPLSEDSLTMDAQYFSFDEDSQMASNTLASMKAFVSQSTSFLGSKRSTEATASVMTQVSAQREHHEVQGTLIITARCTHRDAVVLAPFILDVDKAIRVWNRVFPGRMIKTNSPGSMAAIAAMQETPMEQSLTLLSGATYGSSFIGMVHVLKSDNTSAQQAMVSMAASLQQQMVAGAWMANAQGGFGVDSQFSSDVKRMLSTQQISSHVSVVTVGAIPSIKSNDVQVGVQHFADFDPASMMGKLATLANATSADQKSVQEGAQAARTGGQMVQIRSAEIQSVMTGLAAVDDGKNKMLDINSLMTAFEDYVDKAMSGKAGVPITYYLKPITAAQLAQMWVAKYFPGQYLTSAGDDTSPVEPLSSVAAGAAPPAAAGAPAGNGAS